MLVGRVGSVWEKKEGTVNKGTWELQRGKTLTEASVTRTMGVTRTAVRKLANFQGDVGRQYAKERRLTSIVP